MAPVTRTERRNRDYISRQTLERSMNTMIPHLIVLAPRSCEYATTYLRKIAAADRRQRDGHDLSSVLAVINCMSRMQSVAQSLVYPGSAEVALALSVIWKGFSLLSA
jgi:hypothetical protein